MAKTIDTLPADIYALFDPTVEHIVNDEYIEEFGENVKNLLRERLKGRNDRRGFSLRFSNLGKQDRQIWYESREEVEGEGFVPKTYFKFLYGDLLEALILFLAKEAGHDVKDEQREIELDGVLGHIDAIIDGTVVDVKSASPYSYKKFKDQTVVENDPFGYIAQLSGYNNVLNPDEPPAFLAFDKVHGDICISEISTSITKDHPPGERIAELREIIASDTPPERCYDAIPDGKSGNMKLDVGCSYCKYKNTCWPGLRTFLYSSGPRYLTKVVKEPDVYEVERVDEDIDSL